MGCLVGGTLATLGLSTEFLGELILFGGLLALGQVGFVASRFREPLFSTILWFLLSFFGWIGGSTMAFVGLRIISYNPAEPSALQVFFLSLPWVFLGLGQAVALATFSGLRWAVLSTFLLTWFIVASVGGMLITAAGLPTIFQLDVLGYAQGELTDWLGYAARYAVLIAVAYGVPTGLVLALFAGGFGRRQPEGQ